MGLGKFFTDIIKKLIVNILTIGVIGLVVYFLFKWLFKGFFG